jgi:hypothetical protein
VARVSAIAPDNSACSCARCSRAGLKLAIHTQHDLCADAGYSTQIHRGFVLALSQRPHTLRQQIGVLSARLDNACPPV